MTSLLEESIALWRECPCSLPACGRLYEAADQTARERQLTRFLDGLQAELRSLPRNRAERDAARQRITEAFVYLGRTALDLGDHHIELLLNRGFSAIGTELARQARRFDPSVSTADILQASRNAWTACGLQMLLGRPMRVTPSIFAYSMLYPYTDNYLDDPAITPEAKLGFSARFGARLAGEDVAAVNGHEESIWGLIALIEGEYERSRCPQVFASLLGIHHAQEQSIRLLRHGLSRQANVDVVRLSFDKGGTSVLADGYLAAGSLSEAEARFVFGWGVLLQLADDLQDVRQDCEDGMLTVFSEHAGRRPLDEVTSRTLHFGQRVMELMEPLGEPDCRALKELIVRSSRSMIVRSAGEAPALYSAEYLAELEKRSPFRFAFLNGQQRQLAKRRGLLIQLFETFLQGEEDEPAFPMLPGSLLPRF